MSFSFDFDKYRRHNHDGYSDFEDNGFDYEFADEFDFEDDFEDDDDYIQ